MSATSSTEEITTAETAGAAPQKTSKRRGAVVGLVGLAVAIGVGALGLVMHGNYTFAKNNVAKQLSEQRIRFKPAATLTPEEKATPCLVKYAGQALTTAVQAECYANHFIGVHLKSVAGGKTFYEMRDVQTTLAAQIDQAKAANDPALPDLQHQLAAANGQRSALLEGETVRGLLLTSYGFGTLGAKAAQASTVAFGTAATVALASIGLLALTATRRSN